LKKFTYRAVRNKNNIKSYEQFFMDTISHPTVTKINRHAIQQHINRIMFSGPRIFGREEYTFSRKSFTATVLETRTF
jgi:hypothetical protein